MIYCAIIGDIVKSRKYTNRQEIQLKFKSIIKDINTKYSDDIASNFTVTLGDEFQGLLLKPSISYKIIKEIKLKMAPIELVFGIGIGKMDTTFDKNISIGSDGPAYHYARKMIGKSKKKEPSICYYFDDPEYEILNSLIDFIESCVSNRTKRQKEIISKYEELKSQTKVASHLAVSQTNISKTLDKAFFYKINNAEEKIEKFLKSKFS